MNAPTTPAAPTAGQDFGMGICQISPYATIRTLADQYNRPVTLKAKDFNWNSADHIPFEIIDDGSSTELTLKMLDALEQTNNRIDEMMRILVVNQTDHIPDAGNMAPAQTAKKQSIPHGKEPAAWKALQALENPYTTLDGRHIWDMAIMSAMRTILEAAQETQAVDHLPDNKNMMAQPVQAVPVVTLAMEVAGHAEHDRGGTWADVFRAMTAAAPQPSIQGK